MPYIEWSDEYSVNVREIDRQHRTLVERINALHEALLANQGREAQGAVIDAMVDYAATHFETEEGYMRRLRFPGYENHRQEHERFTEKALDLQARSRNDGFVLTLEVLNFLKGWLQEHILGTDRKYTSHFNAGGMY